MYIRVGDNIYFDSPDMIGGKPTLCGKVCIGNDEKYVQWYV